MSRSKRRKNKARRDEPHRPAPPDRPEGVAEPGEPVSNEPDAVETDEGAAADPVEPAPSRRSFFRQAWWVLGGIAALEYVWLVISFLRPRRPAEARSGIVVAGPVTGFEPGTVTAFQRGKFYLSRLEDGSFLALSRECTHLGCTVPWDEEEGRFVCPCHASAYDARGVVVSPPAPRPLDLFPIRIENDVIKVDTAEPRKRLRFQEDQVTAP